MPEWKKVGMDLGTGLVAGVADQGIAEYDAKRESDYEAANPGKKLGMLKKFGTYLNYGLPLVSVILVGADKLRGDWATRATTVSGQLVGRQGMAQLTKKHYVLTYSAAALTYRPVKQIIYQGVQNPAMINTQEAVPTVQPQSNYGIRSDI